MKKLSEKVGVVILSILLYTFIIFGSGCDSSMTIRAKAFYPEENNGEVWKSRQANPEKPIWSWGNAGK